MPTSFATDNRRLRARRALLAMSTVLCSGLAVPARAQSAMPMVSTVDENGVDMSTMIYSPESEEISIGQGEFPARLYDKVTRGNAGGSNLDASVSGYFDLTATQSQVAITIGRISRSFNSDANITYPLAPQPGQFLPLDRRGGYVMKTVESGSTVYTYYSSTGDALRFVVSPGTTCGRAITGQTGSPITCAKISRWTAPNGVTADFTYVIRSQAAYLGYSNETDLTKVSNSLGLTLDFTYASFKDSGKYTDPVYAITSILASSNQLGTCNAQPSCSRSVGYQYLVAPPIDPNALGWTQVYLSQYTNSLNQSTQYTYTMQANGLEAFKSVRRPANPTVDALTLIPGAPLKVVDSLGNTWSYSRTINSTTHHVTTTRTDPLGKTRVYEFDQLGNLVRFQDELTQTTTWEYEYYNRVTKATLPNGIVIIPGYDTRSNVTSTTVKAVPAMPPIADIVTSATYDTNCTNAKTCNQPNTTTDARGNTTSYTYDSTHGGVLTVTQPPATAGAVSPQTRFTYGTASGAYVLTGMSTCHTTASCTGTADETKVVLGYGANGLLPTSKSVQAGDGSLQSTVSDTYDALDNLVSEDGPLPDNTDTAYKRYDQLGRVVGEIQPDPDGSTGPLPRTATRTTYDADGNVTKTELGTVNGVTDTDWVAFSPSLATSSTFDADDRKTSDAVTSGGTTYSLTQYSYDAASNLDCSTVRMNSAAWSSLPPSACTPQTDGTVGADRITKYTYDDAGHPTKITAGYGTSGPVDLARVTYTNTGKVQTAIDAKGNVTGYTYDGFDRLAQTNFPDKTNPGTINSADYEAYSYDANGNRLTLRKRDGNVITYGYDALNHVTSKVVPAGGTSNVYYGYDLAGSLSWARFGSSTGLGVTNVYDALGRLTSTTNDMGYAPLTLGYLYDAAGNRLRITHPDGTYFTYDYDNVSRATTIKANGASVIATIGYDALGRRSNDTRGAAGTASTSYGYDAASRLSSLTSDLTGTGADVTSGFNYNPAGQIVSKSRSNGLYAFAGYAAVNRGYTSNGLNQYSTVASNAYAYDANGNLTSDSVNTYNYDVENRLTSVVSSAGTTGVLYDPLGRLWRIVRAGGGGSWEYLHDDDDIVARYNFYGTGSALNMRYVHGPGTDEPMVWYTTSSIANPMGLQSDYQGSIVSAIDASGNLVGINAYDDYGIPTTTFTSPKPLFGYTGQVYLPELGLNYYKARMYSPTLGRFMQTDPIGYGDGINWYNYAGGDPINGSDPTGLDDCPECSYGYLNYTYGNYQPNPPSQSYGSPPGFNYGTFNDFGGWGLLPSLARNAPVNQVQFTATVRPPKTFTFPLDRCSAEYKAADWALWGFGVIGDGLQIVGLLTLQPELVVAGKITSLAANAGSLALHAGAGDGGAAAGDVVGFGAGLIPGGGTFTRRMYFDLSRDAAGRFVKGQAARYATQNAAVKMGQSRFAGTISGSLGGCKSNE